MGHVIRFYHKAGDFCVGFVDISGVDVGVLRKVFGLPFDNPMYDCYFVDADRSFVLGGILGVEFDLDAYDYFVEFDQ